MIALRMRSTDSQGRTDFAGSSREYRDRLSEIFRRTNMRPTDRANISSAARRMAGNILREVLSPSDLALYGLMEDGPSERKRKSLQGMYVPAAVQAVLRTSATTDTTADALRMAQGALGIVSRITPEAIDALTGDERATLATLAGHIEDRAYELRMLVTPDED